MKNLKIITVPIIACLLFLTSCENESGSQDFIDTDTANSIESTKEESFDFSRLETVEEEGLIEQLENDLIKNIDQFNDIEGLEETVGDFKPDLNIFNDYLRYKGEKEIDVNTFYEKGKSILSDENASVDDFTNLLSEYKIYNDVQLDLFKSFDKAMSRDLSKDEYLREVDLFKESIHANRELTLADRNTMLIYASLIKGFVYTDHFDAQKNQCKDCLKKNKWKIFGWGAFFWLMTLIPCIFTGPGFIACILVMAGFWALYAIKIHCSWACPWI